jgi:hypothetical protein
MNFMFILLREFYVRSKYDEMNFNLVFGVFYNVIQSAYFGYMK